MNKKVIIADPHPIVIDALTSVVNTFDNLNRLNKIVTDGSELNNVLSLYYPDILVIDLDLPNFEGIKSLKSIKRKFRHIKILVYNSKNDIILALNCIKAGAVGYLCKTAPVEALKIALERISNGGIYISEDLNRLLNSSSNNLIETNLT